MPFAPHLVVRSGIAALVAAMVAGPAFSTAAVAAQPEAAQPGAVASVPEPSGDAGAIPSDAAATVPEPVDPPAGDEASAPAPAEPAVDPSLLDAREPDDAAAARPVATRPTGRSPEEQLAALDDAYAARYRPPNNPLRLNVTGRLMFANISGRQQVNGRMGGGAVDIGPSWNRVGVAGTVTGWAGRVLLAEGSGAEMNAMIGGGLTAGLGRLALLSHGYLDLRVGYDVLYGVVNQRADAPVVVTDGTLVVEPARNLVPHGPRARMDLGLVGAGNRRFFHGFGLSIGYQALVGSMRGPLPFTNMLTLGISYWMG
jgi:hypothetical protein